MITLNATVGKQLRIPLFSSNLATSLTIESLDLDAALDGVRLPAFSSEYSVSLTEIDSVNYPKAYVLSITPQSVGTLLLTIVYSSYTETYVIQVEREDLSFLSGKVQGATGDYVFTVKTAEDVPIEDVTVRVFNSAQTKVLQQLSTDTDGQVTVSAPAGTYKLVLSKTNYTFTNPQTITIAANDATEPHLLELIPSTVASGGIIAIKGLYFGSGTQVRFGGAYVTPTSIGTNQDILVVTVPSGIVTSSIEVGLRKSDPNTPGSYLTANNTLTLGIS